MMNPIALQFKVVVYQTQAQDCRTPWVIVKIKNRLSSLSKQKKVSDLKDLWSTLWFKAKEGKQKLHTLSEG